MWRKVAVVFCIASGLLNCAFAQSDEAQELSTNQFRYDVFKVSIEPHYKKIAPDSGFALAFHFDLDKDWHFYASEKTAPGGMNLKIKPTKQDNIRFAEARFPESETYFDKVLQQSLDVFSNRFTVVLPFTVGQANTGPAEAITAGTKLSIEGAYCSAQQCRIITDFWLDTKVIVSGDRVTVEAKLAPPELTPTGPATVPALTSPWVDYSVWFALGLAFLAGLALNIMPCVWPVLPIIVMRIVEHSKQSKGRSIAMGLTFCLGILLFFACLATANIILQVFYGTVLQWGDQFRNPAFVTGMALLLVVLALFMFGLFTITVPSSIAGKSGSGKGYPGAVGMGFLAAILSTPCSFGILAAAFAWAQGQRLILGTLAIMVIGAGMAAPYAILTSMPGLLKRLPKAGRWMEIFKQAVGFVLLFIAVWLVAALPQTRRSGVLYFALTLSFCVWMWAGWVGYNTKPLRKVVVRIIAVVLVVLSGLFFLVPREKVIDWQPYNAALIETALDESRPVLIEFTADWCLSCRVIEIAVYSRKEVAQLIREKNVLAIKADTTVKDNPATLALKEVYNEPGVPVSMLFLPGRKEPVKWRGKGFADRLQEVLETLPSK